MKWKSVRGALASILGLGLLAISSNTRAEPVPPGAVARNIEAVGYTDLGGLRGFKLAIKEVRGRWYLYTGMSTGGFLILDVTDPANPTLVKKVAGPKNTNTVQVSLHGDLLITPRQIAVNPDWDYSPDNPLAKMDDVSAFRTPYDKSKPYEEGVAIWDISDPVNPKQISHWNAGGKGTSEQHRGSYPGGRYAYLSTEMPGYKGKILVILDVSDPVHPKETGRWFNPDQKLPDGAPDVDARDGFHGPPMISPDGKVAVAAYAPNFVNLDISEPAHPKKLGSLQFIPPFQVGEGTNVREQHLHSALPIWDRNIVVVSGEISVHGCGAEGASFIAVVDNRNLSYPKLMSIFPNPAPAPEEGFKSYCEKGGYVGPHNLNQETHSPDVLSPESLIFVAHFNAGLRVYDISDPYTPKETGYYVPPQPLRRSGWAPFQKLRTATEDLLVDRRGYIYITDKQWGIHVLKYTGPVPEGEAQVLRDRAAGN